MLRRLKNCGQGGGEDIGTESSVASVSRLSTLDFKFRVAASRGPQPSIDNMASSKTCISQLSRSVRSALSPAVRPSTQLPPPFLLPFQQHRTAVQSANAQKYKRKDQPTSAKKKKSRTTFVNYDLKDAIQFPLVDAMRYVSCLFTICPQQDSNLTCI